MIPLQLTLVLGRPFCSSVRKAICYMMGYTEQTTILTPKMQVRSRENRETTLYSFRRWILPF
jgi:hypothetical protein